jgi:hypothetical protein
MSIINFSKWVVNMINSHMDHFLWNNNEDKHVTALKMGQVGQFAGWTDTTIAGAVGAVL